jgi:hypothetical protein
MVMPEPVQRYFAHALPAGSPPGGVPAAVRLRMTGPIKFGLWVPFTAHEECDGLSFAWRARVGPLHVTDRFADGAGGMRGRLFGRRTVFDVSSGDVTRSSAGRAALEAIWCPVALLPDRGVTWRAEADDQIVAAWDVPPERPELPPADRSGWRRPRGERAALGQRRAQGGQLHPVRLRGARRAPLRRRRRPERGHRRWWFGTPDYEPFFTASIEDVRGAPPGQRSQMRA